MEEIRKYKITCKYCRGEFEVDSYKSRESKARKEITRDDVVKYISDNTMSDFPYGQKQMEKKMVSIESMSKGEQYKRNKEKLILIMSNEIICPVCNNYVFNK